MMVGRIHENNVGGTDHTLIEKMVDDDVWDTALTE